MDEKPVLRMIREANQLAEARSATATRLHQFCRCVCSMCRKEHGGMYEVCGYGTEWLCESCLIKRHPTEFRRLNPDLYRSALEGGFR